MCERTSIIRVSPNKIKLIWQKDWLLCSQKDVIQSGFEMSCETRIMIDKRRQKTIDKDLLQRKYIPVTYAKRYNPDSRGVRSAS
jgi:hypothetical protein